MENLERLLQSLNRHWWSLLLAYASNIGLYLLYREFWVELGLEPISTILKDKSWIESAPYPTLLRMTWLAAHVVIILVIVARLWSNHENFSQLKTDRMFSRNQWQLLRSLAQLGDGWIHARYIQDHVQSKLPLELRQMTWKELFYRLEVFRLLQLVERHGAGLESRYRLTSQYWQFISDSPYHYRSE